MDISLFIVIWSFVLGPTSGQDGSRFGRFDRQVDDQAGIVALELDAADRLVRVTRSGRILVDEAEVPLPLTTLSAPIRDLDIDGDAWLVGTDDGLGMAHASDSKTWYFRVPEVRAVSQGSGVAMALTKDGSLIAVDAETGDPRWKHVHAYPGARAVQVLPDGGAWVADTDRHRLVRVDDQGEPLQEVGDRGAFPGLFNTPTDLELLGDRLLVADHFNHRIAVHRADDGSFLDQWGMHAVVPREGKGRIHYPESLAVDRAGEHVFVLEPFERRYHVFGKVKPGEEPTGSSLPEKRGVESHFGSDIARDDRFLAMWEPESASVVVFELSLGIPVHVTTFGHGGAAPIGIGRLTSIAVDGVSRDVWLLDEGHRRLSRWSLQPERKSVSIFDPFMGRFARGWPWEALDRASAAQGGPDSVEPVDLVAGDGQLHILDRTGPSILVTDRTLGLERVVMLPDRVDPTEFGRSASGGWWVLDPGRSALLAVEESGVVGREIDLDGLGIEDPHGVVEIDGLVVVSDRATDRWISLDSTGRIVASGGESGAWDGALWRPAGLTSLPGGRFAIVDRGNHRAQGYDPRSGDWAVTFSLGQGHDAPRTTREDFETTPEADEEQPEDAP